MKIVTIIGARPQFIKAAPVSRALRKKTEWVESDWNIIVKTDIDRILAFAAQDIMLDSHPDFYGDGWASEKIAEKLKT